MDPIFSLLLPFYKQENIEEVLGKYLFELSNVVDSFELIAIINGTRYSALDKLVKLATNKESRLLVLYVEQSGWGRAIHEGSRIAKGLYVCYTNSARTDPQELIGMLKYAKLSECAVVTAKRIIRDSWIRGLSSWLFNLEARLVLGIQVSDINATPKIIPSRVLQSIHLQSNGDLFDAELLYQLKIKKIPVIEIPIYKWRRNTGRSTTNLKSALRMLFGIPKILLQHKK